MKNYLIIILALVGAQNAVASDANNDPLATGQAVGIGGFTKHGTPTAPGMPIHIPARYRGTARHVGQLGLKLEACFEHNNKAACKAAARDLKIAAKATTVAGYQRLIRQACDKTNNKRICAMLPPKSTRTTLHLPHAGTAMSKK